MAIIRKGDLVQVISGPTQDRGGDRGKQGRVIEVLQEKNRIIVEGVNFVTKHSRVGQTQRGTKTGGIETMEAPIHVSNVALVNPDTKLPARVGFKVETDDRGKTVRVRYFKDSRRAPAKKSKAAKSDDKAEVTEDAEKAPKAAKSTTKTEAKATKPKAAKKDDE
jgi:large subunit ribosomal protein L24